MSKEKLNELKTQLAEINNLKNAVAVLNWDQSTYMPSGGATARSKQLATLSKISHEKFTSTDIGKLLENLQAYAETLPVDSDDACLIRVVTRDYEKATKVPADFLATFNAHSAQSYQTWIEARPQNSFAKVKPYLEKTLEFSRQLSEYLGYKEHIADPLIDASDEGVKVSQIRPLFSELRNALVPLLRTINGQAEISDACLRQYFAKDKQLAFGLKVAECYGYDLSRGRQDLTAHPFCTSFSINDVRITTRVREDYLADALFSTLHEAGHAIYEQGVDVNLEGTPLATGASSGVHESQSRLWENIVGRSKSFWQYYHPKLQETFPELNKIKLEEFYSAINRVKPSLIRVDADELTYNLHIIIRFNLECDLLEGKLDIKDLPEAWNACYKQDLGVEPPSDVNGVLQDVHWYAGTIGGAFQGYSLGNILSAQFYSAAIQAEPNIPKDMIKGDFKLLHKWLRENIYKHGRKFSPDKIIEGATGKSLTIEPYMNYLTKKYNELYS